MLEIEASEAGKTPDRLLDLVEQGEEIVITRRGKPAARMRRESSSRDLGQALEAARRVREGHVLWWQFDWNQWKACPDEGRN